MSDEKLSHQKIFWMQRGPLKGRYALVWGQNYPEVEFSPAFPGRAVTPRAALIDSGTASLSFESLCTQITLSGGVEVTPEACGTLALYFNLASFPDLSNYGAHSFKVFPALGVNQLEAVFEAINTLARTLLARLKPLTKVQKSQLESKLQQLQVVFSPKVTHWIYYALSADSVALTVGPLHGVIYEIDERLLDEPFSQENSLNKMGDPRDATFVPVSLHGFNDVLLQMIHSLERNKNIAFIGSVGRFKAWRTVAILRTLVQDEVLCALVDDALADIGKAIAITSNYRKVVCVKSA